MSMRNDDITGRGLVCFGFLVGSILSADLALRLPTEVLTRIFGAILVAVGLRMLFVG